MLLVVVVALFVGAAVAMKRAGWFDGVDDGEVERARSWSQHEHAEGPHHLE